MIAIDQIKEYTGGDDEFIEQLFQKFLSRLDEDLQELNTAAQDEDWPQVRKKTHLMLSSARIFYLTDIIALSKSMEEKIDANQFAGLQKDVDTLTTMYRNFEKEANAWIAR